MNLMLRSTEYRGDAAGVANFLFFNCTEAIRRAVWIRERERLTVEAPSYARNRNSAAPTICSGFHVMSSASNPATHPAFHPA